MPEQFNRTIWIKDLTPELSGARYARPFGRVVRMHIAETPAIAIACAYLPYSMEAAPC